MTWHDRARGRRRRPSAPAPRRADQSRRSARATPGDDRAHLAAGVPAGTDLDRPAPRAPPTRPARRRRAPTATATEIAMQRWPAEPKAGGGEVVGGEVEVGVGQHDRVVLRAAERLHPLAVRGAALVDVLRDRRRADERHGGDVGVVEQRVDRDLVAVDDVEDAVRQTGLGDSSATKFDAEGSRSVGLSTNVLPQAIATGCIHIGTITGKLNGVIPAQTPSGWRKRVDVDAGRDLVGVLALEQLRDAAGELDDLQAALHLARASSTTLPCSEAMIAASSLGCAFDQLAEGEHHLGARRSDDCRPLPNAAGRLRPRRRRRRARRARPRPAAPRSRGPRRAPSARPSARRPPPIQCPMVRMPAMEHAARPVVHRWNAARHC